MSVSENLYHIRHQISQAEKKYNRPPGSVMLLAVSKQQGIDKIHKAIEANQYCFGENYVQEALPKIATLRDLPIEWHFIGKLQANKTRTVAEHFSWVHSIDHLKIAERLNKQRPSHLPPLNICIEVNISREENKSGIVLDEVFLFAEHVAQLKNLRLRGLMVIPKPVDCFEKQLDVYQKVQQALMDLYTQGFDLDTLSMGMSHDFEAAIAAGSTIVRVGTAIFGKREAR